MCRDLRSNFAAFNRLCGLRALNSIIFTIFITNRYFFIGWRVDFVIRLRNSCIWTMTSNIWLWRCSCRSWSRLFIVIWGDRLLWARSLLCRNWGRWCWNGMSTRSFLVNWDSVLLRFFLYRSCWVWRFRSLLNRFRLNIFYDRRLGFSRLLLVNFLFFFLRNRSRWEILIIILLINSTDRLMCFII